jgi:hypothetical protein
MTRAPGPGGTARRRRIVVHSTWRAIGQAVSIYLAIGSCAVTAQDNRPGRATFAEMIAYARLAVGACERLAPDADGFYALALMRLIKPPITEKEIVAKEKDVKRLRDRLGLRKWCQLYAGEMARARILVEALRKQN